MGEREWTDWWWNGVDCIGIVRAELLVLPFNVVPVAGPPALAETPCAVAVGLDLAVDAMGDGGSAFIAFMALVAVLPWPSLLVLPTFSLLAVGPSPLFLCFPFPSPFPWAVPLEFPWLFPLCLDMNVKGFPCWKFRIRVFGVNGAVTLPTPLSLRPPPLPVVSLLDFPPPRGRRCANGVRIECLAVDGELARFSLINDRNFCFTVLTLSNA